MTVTGEFDHGGGGGGGGIPAAVAVMAGVVVDNVGGKIGWQQKRQRLQDGVQ